MANHTAPPPPTGSNEAEEAAWEMATAETLRARGELAEAANWYRRAANHLMEAGDDERAISVAKLAAELAALDDAGRSGSLRAEKTPAPDAPAKASGPPPVPALKSQGSGVPTAHPPPVPAKPAAVTVSPPATGAAATTATSGAPRQKLPWQRSSRPPPPRPASRASMPVPRVTGVPGAGTPATNAGAQPRPGPPPPPAAARPAMPSRSAPALPSVVPSPPLPKLAPVLPSDDEPTSQVDTRMLESTRLDLKNPEPTAIEQEHTHESPLAALVDEAVTDLRKSNEEAHRAERTEPNTRRPPSVSPERLAETDQIAARLPALPLFAEFSAEQVRSVARQASLIRFEAGEYITEAGAPEGPMYVLVEGDAQVGVAGDESRHVSIGAGDFVGEISAVYGGPRMATVVASGNVEAVAFAPSMVRWMLGAIPSFAEAVHEAIGERVRDSLPHLAPAFRHLDVSERVPAFSVFELEVVEAGDALITEGQAVDALFIVAAGEVEMYGGRAARSRPLRGRVGEVIGLTALHGDEAAGATVRAVRRTMIAKLPRARFAEWIDQYPRAINAVDDVGSPGRGVLC